MAMKEVDLTFEERELIRASYHERVKEWVCDGIVYPVSLCVAFWCMMAIAEKLIN